MKNNMKKMYLIMFLVASVALLAPTLVFATESNPEADDEDEISSVIDEQTAYSLDTVDDTFDCSQGYLKIRGKWGQGKEKDADGFFGGRITRKGRVYVFKGVYNKTGEDERTRIVGFMKKGYFNGKIITDEGEHKITGLYTIDKENKLLKLQWMIPGHAGWAVGRISVPSE